MFANTTGFRRTAGFTLVEMLVVVLIASIVMAVLISVLTSSFAVLRTGESRAQLNAAARQALDHLADDITSASGIPLSSDRDLNGRKDEVLPLEGGYGDAAEWRVGYLAANNVVVVDASYYLSEAWGDRIMLDHNSKTYVNSLLVENQNYSVPEVLNFAGTRRVADFTSFYRLAVPANNLMPYCLASEWDANNDGIVDSVHNGNIDGYPDSVTVGPRKETANIIEDLFYKLRDEDQPRRVRQLNISSNITRVKYEYLQQVPVYLSRVTGNAIQVAYQNLSDGTITWVNSNYLFSSGTMDDLVPLISHFEQRVIDVAPNAPNNNGGFWVDPVTGANYGVMVWDLRDQYPEGYVASKVGALNNWNCPVFYNTSTSGANSPSDNAPIDRQCYVTTSLSGGVPLSGGTAMIRPDMTALHGASYFSYTQDPTGIGDMGDADGIPDGDGLPDDPVPGWWLPYVRAIRVTVVATPRQVIEERMSKSGTSGTGNTTVYYRLDSPIPFADPGRTQPLPQLRKDYVGEGQDLIVTKTVPVNFTYRHELMYDPRDPRIDQSQRRRVELNVFAGLNLLGPDPVDPDAVIDARTPFQRYYKFNP